jgi:hypothetical protein
MTKDFLIEKVESDIKKKAKKMARKKKNKQ